MGMTALILAGGAVAGAAAGGAFSKKPDPAEAPKPTVMPVINDAAVANARRRSLAQQLGRRGRQSTILTAEEDKLGG
jgi:hypothetical protein